MTLYEKQQAVLGDLLEERACTTDGTPWAARLDQKILEMRQAIVEGLRDR